MKTVLITGGSSGIGAKCAELFARKGYRVAISYNTNKAGAEEVISKILKSEGEACMFQAELSKEKHAQALVDSVVQHYGKIDVVVNNAGRYINGDEWHGAEEIWTQTLTQNLVSVMSVSKYCIELFKKQQSGVIVNVASRLGLRGSDEELAYGASKAGIINITQGYANILAPYGRANSVSPGAVNTGYWLTASQDELKRTLATKPLDRLIEPEEVAEAIFFLGSDKSASTTGQNLVVNQS